MATDSLRPTVKKTANDVLVCEWSKEDRDGSLTMFSLMVYPGSGRILWTFMRPEWSYGAFVPEEVLAAIRSFEAKDGNAI